MSEAAREIRVLHVDDDPALGEVVARHLERVTEAITVVTETSARDGLDRLDEGLFDCVVSDHDMPGMNGLEFLKAVRAEYPDLPFILFTGKGNEEIASDAISAGVTEYLQKDVGTDQYAVLANRIERAVESVRAKAALEESERTLSTLISNLPGMVYRARNEPDWPMLFVGGDVAELTGCPADDIESGAVSWGSLIDDSEADRLWEAVQNAVAADEPFEVTYRIETVDGETRWCWERGRAVETAADGVEILEGFVTDITARKRRERELKREREFTETLFDAVEDPFYLLGPDGELRRWNDTVTEVTGYSDAELEAMDALDLVPSEYHGEVVETLQETLEDGQATARVPIETTDGSRRQFEFKGARLEDGDGELLGIAGVGREIEAQTVREQWYETLVENVGDAMYALDADGQVAMVNSAMAAHLGYDREEIVGSEPSVFMPEADVERGKELLADLVDEGRTWGTFEMRTVDADGETTINENKISPLFDDGEWVGSVGVIRDIADRKDRERRLSEFAAVVSHDLRGPLNVIQGRLDMARDTGDIANLDDAVAAADQMEQRIDELLSLARDGAVVGETSRVEIDAVARRAWENVETAAASLETAGSTTVEADRSRLRELFENLFRNAAEHGSTAEQSRSDSATDALTVTVGPLDDGFYVADDGCGIPDGERDAVFDRGYTTRSDGTGLGLTIVTDVAEAHGWEIELAESDAGGVRFEFRESPDSP